MKKLTAIRGAVCSKNETDDIKNNVCNLLNLIIQKNKLKEKDIVSIVFSVTDDINVLNPATALRKGTTEFSFENTALFCVQEPEIQNGKKNIIRVMVTCYQKRNLKKENVYINGAENLRQDYLLNS